MRSTPTRDRFQLAGAPEPVRISVTLFSIVLAAGLILKATAWVWHPAGGSAGAAWGDLDAAASTLLLLGLIFAAQSALLATTRLPAQARTAFAAVAALAVVLSASAIWIGRALGLSASVAPAAAGFLAALVGVVGAALVVREVWLPAASAASTSSEEETVWPVRSQAGAPGRTAGRDRHRRGPRPSGAPHLVGGSAESVPRSNAPRLPEAGQESNVDLLRDRDARRRRGRGGRRKGGPRPQRPEGAVSPGGSAAPRPPAPTLSISGTD